MSDEQKPHRSDKEIRSRIDELTKELAELSAELLLAHKTMASHIYIEITDVMGACQVVTSVDVTSPEMLKRIEDKLGVILGMPSEGDPQEPVGKEPPKPPSEVVEELLKSLKKGPTN